MLLSKWQIKQVTDYQSRPLPIIGGCQCHLICYHRHQWHRPSTSHFRWYGIRGRRPLLVRLLGEWCSRLSVWVSLCGCDSSHVTSIRWDEYESVKHILRKINECSFLTKISSNLWQVQNFLKPFTPWRFKGKWVDRFRK